jgi:hypothetical protein
MAIIGYKEDLPKVKPTDDPSVVDVNGQCYYLGGGWTADAHRKEGLTRLAIAEYLDNLKPKLPTEPGSVIAVYKAKGWTTQVKGHFFSLNMDGYWSCLDGFSTDRAHPEEIEDWKPVQLNVVEEA